MANTSKELGDARRRRTRVAAGEADLLARINRDIAETSEEEDAAITAAALNDPDALPNVAVMRQRGRPRSPDKKIPVLLKLDPDLVEKLRASGPGWQTRVNETLRRNMMD